MGISRQEYWSGLPFPSPIMLVYLLVYLSRQHIESHHKQTKPNTERNTQTAVKFANRAHGICPLLWGMWGVSPRNNWAGGGGQTTILGIWECSQKTDKYPRARSSLETSARESLLHLTLWSCAWLLFEMHTWNILPPLELSRAAFMHQPVSSHFHSTFSLCFGFGTYSLVTKNPSSDGGRGGSKNLFF